ncbi:MAG TPA: hypothetical protein VMD79_00610 [Solirubrobacteraceae bacterium]|nr:hypothetical protein [Solirubrobacteraceae bacterium]
MSTPSPGGETASDRHGACSHAGESALAPYQAICEHAELELELAGRGEIDSLAALGARWGELAASLPEHPPAAAAELLERARLIHQRTHIELVRLRDALLADVRTTARARRTADGYAGQLRSRPRIDHRA